MEQKNVKYMNINSYISPNVELFVDLKVIYMTIYVKYWNIFTEVNKLYNIRTFQCTILLSGLRTKYNFNCKSIKCYTWDLYVMTTCFVHNVYLVVF